MAQPLLVNADMIQKEFDDYDDVQNSKMLCTDDEDCHIGDKKKYFQSFICQQFGLLSQMPNIYSVQKQNSDENQELQNKSMLIEKDTDDYNLKEQEISKQSSYSSPLRIQKQGLSLIKNLAGDIENNVEEQQEQKLIKIQREMNTSQESKLKNSNSIDNQSQESQKQSSIVMHENTKQNDSCDNSIDSHDQHRKKNCSPEETETKSIQSACSVSPLKLNQANNLFQKQIQLQSTCSISPEKSNKSINSENYQKIVFFSDQKSKQSYGDLQLDLVHEDKNQSFDSSNRNFSNIAVDNMSFDCSDTLRDQNEAAMSIKFSSIQKLISSEFIKSNVESQQLQNFDQQELPSNGFLCSFPSSLEVTIKPNLFDDLLIPQEPDIRCNMEKLQAQIPKTNCKKTIDEKSQLNNICDYYVKHLLRSVNMSLRDNISCLYREHFLQNFQAFHMRSTIPVSTQKEIRERSIIMPPFEVKKKKTLVLDLDETLVHCNESLDQPSDYILDIQAGTSKEPIKAGINVRPFAEQFLAEMSELFEIVIFTASKSVYANEVINKLDPENKYVFKRLFRDHCIYKKKIHIKDMKIIKNRDIRDIIIVDNCSLSFCHNIENGVPIIPFYDDKNDRELEYLGKFLKTVSEVEDVRTVIQNNFKFNDYNSYQSPSELINEMFCLEQNNKQQ